MHTLVLFLALPHVVVKDFLKIFPLTIPNEDRVAEVSLDLCDISALRVRLAREEELFIDMPGGHLINVMNLVYAGVHVNLSGAQ